MQVIYNSNHMAKQTSARTHAQRGRETDKITSKCIHADVIKSKIYKYKYLNMNTSVTSTRVSTFCLRIHIVIISNHIFVASVDISYNIAWRMTFGWSECNTCEHTLCPTSLLANYRYTTTTSSHRSAKYDVSK